MRPGGTLLLLIGGLLVYANASAWRYERLSRPNPGGEIAQTIDHLSRSHLVALFLCLLWGVAERIGLDELGLGRSHFRRSSRWGLIIGAAGSAVIHVFFALPWVRQRFAPPPEWTALDPARLRRLALGPMLVGSALLEEIAFRGLLHAKLGRALGSPRNLVAEGAVFAAWHLVITWCNLNRCALPRRLLPALYGASLTVLFAVGVALGLLRQRTGHVIGGVVAHWLLLISMAIALNRPRLEGPKERTNASPTPRGFGGRMAPQLQWRG